MKGQVSIEMAILLSIVLVIAVAVGWYMYTTFIAATTGTPRLSVINAIYSSGSGALTLTVQNPGPVATAYIGSVYLQGQLCDIEGNAIPVEQKAGAMTIQVGCDPGLAPAGSTISGRVVLTSGQVFPFTAQVTS